MLSLKSTSCSALCYAWLKENRKKLKKVAGCKRYHQNLCPSPKNNMKTQCKNCILTPVIGRPSGRTHYNVSPLSWRRPIQSKCWGQLPCQSLGLWSCNWFLFIFLFDICLSVLFLICWGDVTEDSACWFELKIKIHCQGNRTQNKLLWKNI